MKRFLLSPILALVLWSAQLPGVEEKRYRLLSVTQTTKMILISELTTKTKYVLDASTAKITVDDKPAEFEDLKEYSVIRVDFQARKTSKDGIDLDGVASEISIKTPDNPK